MMWLGWKKKGSADTHYASFSRRMWAATFDSLLIIVLVAPFFDMFLDQKLLVDLNDLQLQLAAQSGPQQRWALLSQVMVESGQLSNWLVNTAAQSIVLCVLTGICWRLWSSTPGKMLFRMKIVDAVTEAPISNRQIIIRLLGYFVSGLTLFLGFFWISFDKRRQGWHDKFAGTVVIRVTRVKPDSAAARP